MAGRVFIDKNTDSNQHASQRTGQECLACVCAEKGVQSRSDTADVASRRAEQPSLHTGCLPGNEAVGSRSVVAYILFQLPLTTTLPLAFSAACQRFRTSFPQTLEGNSAIFISPAALLKVLSLAEAEPSKV